MRNKPSKSPLTRRLEEKIFLEKEFIVQCLSRSLPVKGDLEGLEKY
jgi:hypothetical protein